LKTYDRDKNEEYKYGTSYFTIAEEPEVASYT
jgi:hypothetical protein